jgi:putative transposase
LSSPSLAHLPALYCNIKEAGVSLIIGTEGIFNTDQGSQYTGASFTGRLKEACVRISMDGKGRAFDNIMIERLWRSVKYEEVYLKDYGSVQDCRRSLAVYFEFYNRERRHQGLGCRTPWDVYQAAA